MNTLPTFQHFKLERLAEGVFAAVGITGGPAHSNAGIIDLGDRTLIFDTFLTPEAGEDLRAAAERLTGRPATYVIISHAHSDHWGGNQVFASDAVIIATRETRAAMPDMIAYLKQIQEDPSEVEKELEEEEERLKTETDPRWRATLESSIARWRYALKSLPATEFWLPHQTFEKSLVFHGAERSVELLTQEKGHTASDAYLVLAEERIVFMGDLGFFQTQPFMVYCDPAAWKRQLEAMEQSEFEIFVPGHGPVGTKTDISLQREYITLLQALAAQGVETGKTVEQVVQQGLPAPFDGWLMGEMNRFERNVQSMYQRLSGD